MILNHHRRPHLATKVFETTLASFSKLSLRRKTFVRTVSRKVILPMNRHMTSPSGSGLEKTLSSLIETMICLFDFVFSVDQLVVAQN